MSTTDELSREKIVEIMQGERFVMLSTATADGKIVSHPMSPQRVDDDAAVWFFISREGGQADAIRDNPKVNLAFAETGSWLSLSGEAEFVDDPALVEELWDEQVASYFPEGKDDPDLALLKVTGESAQYWGVPGNKAVAAVKILVSKVRGTEGPGVMGTTQL